MHTVVICHLLNDRGYRCLRLYLFVTFCDPRFEEVESAERELAQLQNARAIAAVQREAHRIAQRLDSTAEAEAHMQLYAQNQAEMVSCR